MRNPTPCVVIGTDCCLARPTQQRPVSASLVAYAQSLPVRNSDKGGEGEAAYDLYGLTADLLAQAKRNLTSNNVVIPVLQTFEVLLEADVFEELAGDDDGLKRYTRFLLSVSRLVLTCLGVT